MVGTHKYVYSRRPAVHGAGICPGWGIIRWNQINESTILARVEPRVRLDDQSCRQKTTL